MKKLLLLIIGGVVGYLAWHTYVQRRDERDLWAEIAEPVD